MGSRPTTAASPVDAALARGRRLHRQGRLEQALDCYREVLGLDDDHVDALYLTGLVLYRRGLRCEALGHVERAIRLQPRHGLALACLGQMLQDEGRDTEAVERLREAASLLKENASVFNALGVSLGRLGGAGVALEAFDRAIDLDPWMAEAWINRANLHRLEGQLDDARNGYLRALSLRPDSPEAHNNLGVLYQQRYSPASARVHFEAAIRARPGYAEAYNNLGAALNDIGEQRRASACFRQALALAPRFVEAMVNAGVTRHLECYHGAARRAFDAAGREDPEALAPAWCRCVAELESVYRSPQHLLEARRKYQARLRSISARRATAGSAAERSEGWVGLLQPFLLPYQGHDDIRLQSIYGDMLTGPAAGARAPVRRSRSGPIVVGIASGFFREHSNWRIPIRGWLRALSREFRVNGYYTGFSEDACTAEARRLCHRFRSGLSLDELADAVVADAVDVLIYPEIGMHPLTVRLASRRLAPVQCVSWGHPVTSGMNTIDYFLSSALMEQPGAEAHYRERLVRLPGLSAVIDEPSISPEAGPGRADFGLLESDLVYLCVQSLSKYLPQDDELLVSIACRVERARFVFIEGGPGATRTLRRRLKRAFVSAGLDFDQRVVLLSRMSRERFHALNRVADVALDPPHWSGCNTTLDAFAHGLPVVTLPGEFMRGRHGRAFYEKMEYRELIARDRADYVEIAVRLGNDCRWRARQREILADRRRVLYGDPEPTVFLADFIREVATSSRAGGGREPGR